MTSKATFMGNPFDPDGVVTIVGLSGRAEVNIGGPLKKCAPCLWEAEGFMFNSRDVQVMATGEIVRPPVVMAVNRG